MSSFVFDNLNDELFINMLLYAYPLANLALIIEKVSFISKKYSTI